jgi:NifB/MoaA-like Fe-S oxidoreductase
MIYLNGPGPLQVEGLHGLLLEAARDHNVLPLTGRCNLSCCFCSHGQNPPGTRAFDFPPLELELLRELAPYLDPGQKIIIGESATRLREGEPLTHPHFFTILELLRRRFPATPIQVTTNAALLNRENIGRLASLAPLEVVLSLNSATARGRRLLMGDRRPRPALGAAELLARAGVPLHGSVVALPHLAGWDDLRQTLRFLDEAGARTIRLLLPGYTRCSRPALVPPPGTRELCYRLAEELKGVLRAPLLAEPPLIENLDPVVEGVMEGTSARRAGVCAGDLILAVDGRQPGSRVDAFELSRRKANPRLSLQRDGRRVETVLAKQKGEPPGFAVSYDLDPAQVERVRSALRPGGETLMLVSRAALARWQAAASRFGLSSLRLQPVENLYFGGSINCAGLLTAGDFKAVLAQKQAAPAPARVLLPAVAFDRDGGDMAGGSFRELAEIGIPLLLVR